MRYGPEWLDCCRSVRAPERTPIPVSTPVLHAHGAWAYHDEVGLVSRRPGDQEGGPLCHDIVTLFDEIWMSDILPSAAALRPLVGCSSLGRRRTMVSVPHYWRCVVDALHPTWPSEGRPDDVPAWLISRCKRRVFEDRSVRTSRTILLSDDLPTEEVNLEPAVPALLYHVKAYRPQEDGRSPSFIEFRLDPACFIVIYERTFMIANEPCWLEPDMGFRRTEHDSLDEVMRRFELSHFDLGLVTSKCPMSARELLDGELMFRGLENVIDVEEQDGMVSFQVGITRHSNIADFQSMCETLSWFGHHLVNDAWRPRWKDPWHE